MSKSTMVELVAELKKLPKSPEIDLMVSEAKAGEYHDYKNKKYPCGKLEFFNRLMKLGYPDLANRIANGEFDEKPDQQDLANMRRDLASSGFDPDGAMGEILGLKK